MIGNHNSDSLKSVDLTKIKLSLPTSRAKFGESSLATYQTSTTSQEYCVILLSDIQQKKKWLLGYKK